MSTAPRTQAMHHYRNAIQALSDGEYSDLSDEERWSLLRTLQQERQRLLCETDSTPSAPATAPT